MRKKKHIPVFLINEYDKKYSKIPQVYVLAKGDCLFQGATNKLLPYLDSLKLPCPMFHNPADYGTYYVYSISKLL